MEEDRRTSKEYATWVFMESIGRLRKKETWGAQAQLMVRPMVEGESPRESKGEMVNFHESDHHYRVTSSSYTSHDKPLTSFVTAP
jgi:hypothetical protein